jgi:hypothetical protein
MNPRNPLATWQQFAQPALAREFGFAMPQGLRDDETVLGCTANLRAARQDCYPFPSPWPDLSRVRSFFSHPRAARQIVAVFVKACDFPFDFGANRIELSLTTTNRGSLTCVKQSFFSPFSPCRSLAVCKTRHRAALQALPLAQPSLILPTTTPSLAPSLAALQALQPAASTLVCRPAIDLTRRTRGTIHPKAASRVNPPLAVLHFAPARAALRRAHV